jgi:impB/mucB/samB family
MPPQTTTQSSTKPWNARATPPSRIACAWVADPPSWALQRLEPGLRDTPMVVLEGRRVTGRCERARKAGVQIGDAFDRARTLCPEAVMAQLEPSALAAAWESALGAIYRVTPFIESPSRGTAYLGGINPSEAEALAQELSLRVGLASARGSALLAALMAPLNTPRVLSDEALFLSRSPVYVLRGVGISSDTVERLKLFGLNTLGDLLVRTTPAQLEAQFGLEGKRIFEFVHGGSPRAVSLYTPPSTIERTWTFESPVLEPWEFENVIPTLVESTLELLAGRVTGALTVTLKTVLGQTCSKQVLKHYTADFKTVLLVVQRLLEAAHGNLEFDRITLQLSDLRRPTQRQASLFGALERPGVIEAIKTVHQHHPEKIGRLEISQPNMPLRERRIRFVPLDGLEPRVKRAASAKTQRSKKS